MSWLADPEAVARFLVTAFFAIVFLQSGLDKLLDQVGNLSYLKDVFKNSAVPIDLLPLLLWLLTLLELTSGALCALGVLFGGFTRDGMSLAGVGLLMSGLTLLCLLAGQRVAKDYAGAAVIAAYFAVVLIGLSVF